MANRYNDISILLQEVQITISELEAIQDKASRSVFINSLPEGKVKNALENLRSILDYAGHDVQDSLKAMYTSKGLTVPKMDQRAYFPIGKDKGDFGSKIKKDYPGLDVHMSRAYDIIESIQLYKPSKDWLKKLTSNVNPIKHDRLTGNQLRHDTSVLSFGPLKEDPNSEFVVGSLGGDMEILSTKISINGGPEMEMLKNPVDVKGGRIISTPEIEEKGYKIEYATSFKFLGTDDDIIKLLKKTRKEISKLVASLYPHLL